MEAIIARMPLLSRLQKPSGWKRCPKCPQSGFRTWRGLLSHAIHAHGKTEPVTQSPPYGPTDVSCPSCGGRMITLRPEGWMAVSRLECQCGFEWEQYIR